MDRSTRAQLADAIADSIAARRARPLTTPSHWCLTLFGPLLDRRIPMTPIGGGSRNPAFVILALLVPFVILSFVIALPVEWYRARRVRAGNAAASRLLEQVSEPPRDAYRGSANDASTWLAELKAAQLLAVDYRIERHSRLSFCGTALLALGAGGPRVAWLSIHRRAPRGEVADGARLAVLLRDALGRDVPLAFWAWDREDSFDLSEREARPW